MMGSVVFGGEKGGGGGSKETPGARRRFDGGEAGDSVATGVNPKRALAARLWRCMLSDAFKRRSIGHGHRIVI